MQLKTVFLALFAAIYCAQSFCMQQNNFDADQIRILTARMKENPDSFNALTRNLAHQLYQQYPTIKRSELINFFRASGVERSAILPLGFIKQIWQLIVSERNTPVIEKSRAFIINCCNHDLTHPLQPAYTMGDYRFFPAAFEQEMANYLRSKYHSCVRLVNDHITGKYGYGDLKTDECITSLNHLNQAAVARLTITRGCSPYEKRIHFLYGAHHAILIIIDGDEIIVVTHIPYNSGVTTGQELINNIWQANECRRFTDWRLAYDMLEHLDLSQY